MPVRFMLLCALGAAPLLCSTWARAQTGGESSATSALCSRDSVFEIIRQQIDATKTFDDPVQRIGVLLRAADLLWPYQQDKARTTFTEAFDLAGQNFKEKGDEPKLVGQAALVATPDQRYVVIRAIAKRDAVWAKKLADEMLKKERQEVAEATARNPRGDVRTAEKLLDSAILLLPSDLNAVNNFATASLSYPASPRLTVFLYKFAEVNQQAADQFYERALAVYGDRPMREFLYLAAYPFAFDETGDMPLMGPYTVPATFAPNSSLQRLFVRTLLRRAQQALQTPLDEGDNYNGFPGAGHILQVLTRIGPQVQKAVPDLSGAVAQARNSLLDSLAQEQQAIFLRPQTDPSPAPGKTFAEQIEAAQTELNANRRDEMLVTAILNAGLTESLERVVNAADKIAEPNLRAQLLDWLYFSRTQRAIKDKHIDEAMQAAAKVQELDQRAYLYSEIAKESLKTIENQSQALEVLDNIVTTAGKGPNTMATARALLSAAYLYSKIDPGRSVLVLAEAVKSINRLDAPDFSRQSLIRKLEGRNFARYTTFRTPGFDPENTFRELAKIGFDNALFLASGFTDKYLRALTTLTLAEFCLQRAEQQEKAERGKKKVKP
ncbi:MAG TPA: hypothetical protein VF525_06880 [Pyrinomonadaceae bacterium]